MLPKKHAEEDLAIVSEKLAVIEDEVNKLQSAFMAAIQEKARVEQDTKSCVERLSLAEQLITGLASERSGWIGGVFAQL